MKSIRSFHHELKFVTPGGTSRGVLYHKNSYYLLSEEGDQLCAIGEASYLPGLNPESEDSLLIQLSAFSKGTHDASCEYSPAMRFATEMFELGNGSTDPFTFNDSPFTRGEMGIEINGLIWMGDRSNMLKQFEQKINQGFRCIKLKVGALDFDEEMEILSHIRRRFTVDDIELRLDANGAFSVEEADEKLKQLSDYDIHSIEQPIRAGQLEHMSRLCDSPPIPIALDEELIGISDMETILADIRPQYIILKPSLLGGINNSVRCIELAKKYNIGWWATSALESNVGLNYIAQWISTMNVSLPQGLGTGQVFSNNIPSPLVVRNAKLYYDRDQKWDISQLKKR